MCDATLVISGLADFCSSVPGSLKVRSMISRKTNNMNSLLFIDTNRVNQIKDTNVRANSLRGTRTVNFFLNIKYSYYVLFYSFLRLFTFMIKRPFTGIKKSVL